MTSATFKHVNPSPVIPDRRTALTALVWPDQWGLELSPDGRGGVRVAVLTDQPRWNAAKGDPERPGVTARPFIEAERGLTLGELRQRINGVV